MSLEPPPSAPDASAAPEDEAPPFPPLRDAVPALPPPAQKALGEGAPPKLRELAAKGVAPGFRPGDALVVVLLLADGPDEDPASAIARATLAALPKPLAKGALAAPLPAAALHALAPHVAEDLELAEALLRHPAVSPVTVAVVAALGSEPVTELVATNEERLLAHPRIIESLYKNAATRMSTADRILELAVRNGIELRSHPVFAQAALAIREELIPEPTDERNFDDDQFDDAQKIAEATKLAEGEALHEVDEATGQEVPIPKAKPLQALWSDMRPSAKIRLIMLSSLTDARTKKKVRYDGKAIRQVGVRDANPLVAVAALKAPGVNDAEIERIAGIKTVAEDVLRVIALNRSWMRSYLTKKSIVMNPRSPVAVAAQWLPHMRENDLKTIVKSRDVPGAVQNLAKQLLAKKKPAG